MSYYVYLENYIKTLKQYYLYMQKFEIFFVMKLKKKLNDKKRRKLMEIFSDEILKIKKKRKRKELLFLKCIQNAINQISLKNLGHMEACVAKARVRWICLLSAHFTTAQGCWQMR